jgi:hypothetical protein
VKNSLTLIAEEFNPIVEKSDGKYNPISFIQPSAAKEALHKVEEERVCKVLLLYHII